MSTIISLLIGSIAFGTLCAGCTTTFEGDAHFPGGASACQAQCEQDDLEMASFVYVGEFSSACV